MAKLMTTGKGRPPSVRETTPPINFNAWLTTRMTEMRIENKGRTA